MKTFLVIMLVLATAFGTVIRSYIDEKGQQIDHHVGSYLIKASNGGLYRVQYDMEMLGGNLIMNLDQVKGIRKVQCDLTDIEMVVEFSSVPDAYNFYKDITVSASDRFVTGGNWNCSEVQAGSYMLMRRVIEAEIKGVTVLLRTSQGSYEEAFKDGFVTLDKAEEPQEHSKTFCLGVNTQGSCDVATRALPIYQNKFITLTCSNCFVGAKATVFIDLRISAFKLRHIGAGLRDISVNAAFVLDLLAQASASGSIDKTYRIVDGGLIIQFWIGPVPVTIWYEIPLQLLANAMITLKAHAMAGAKAIWSLGNAYVEWDESTGWKTAKPTPSFHWEPVLSGEANMDAEASLSIIPSFIVHVCRIIQAGVRLVPTMMMKAHGDTNKKEICLDLSYKLIADISAGISINLPFIKLVEKTFGPYELYNSGEKPIGHWCVKA